MKNYILSRAFLLPVAGLLLMAMLFSPRPAVRAQGPPTGTKGIGAVLQPFVDKQTLAGAVVLVADKDKVLAEGAVGYADISGMRKMISDALFWIASMSKPITAAALMILVDEGKVALDDPVEKYLPEFKNLSLKGKDKTLLKPSRPITVRDVLSHTSGLPFGSPQESPTIDVLPLKDAVKTYPAMPLLFNPGEGYQYSNAGINTAGRIIEVVSGMPYEEFLQKRLFTPLGMKDTTFWPTGEQLKRLAKSYKPGKDKTGLVEMNVAHLKYPLNERNRYAVPGGGLFSTANDVGRFCQMVLGNGVFEGKRYLSEKAVKEMSKRQTGAALKESYGLGWSVGGSSFGHGGAYSTNMNIDTKRGLITVFMVQHAGFPGDGGQSLGAFRRAAEERFGAKK